MVCWAGCTSSAEAAAAWPALRFPGSLGEAEPPGAEPTYSLPPSRAAFVKISHHTSRKRPCSVSCHGDSNSRETR